MAVYNADGNAISLNKIYSYADRVINSELISQLYSRVPLLTFFTGRMRGDSALQRPGTMNIIGGGGNFSRAMMEEENGVETHDRIQSGTTAGGKWLGERDTMPSLGMLTQADNVVTAVHRWAGPFVAPVKIPNQFIRVSRGSARIASVTREATEQAMEYAITEINNALWYGNPADQSANIWTKPLGVFQALNTSNTYGNITRTGATHFYAGKRVTTANRAALNLVDDANLQQGIMNIGGGVDFGLCSKEIYIKLKQEALSRGQAVFVGDMPEAAKVGVKMECIKYGNVTITWDPTLTGDLSAFDSDITDATKVIVFFTSKDWIITFNPGCNFTLSEFRDQSDREGADDATIADIKTMLRSRCKKPGRSILYTNVS